MSQSPTMVNYDRALSFRNVHSVRVGVTGAVWLLHLADHHNEDGADEHEG